MIQFRHLRKAFGPKVVLNDVSFDVNDGEVFFIIGASGAGKSVCIKHLVGLLKPDSGQVLLDDEDIAQLTEEQFYRIRKKVAMVFQHSTLFDSMTCAENVALPLRKHKNMNDKEALAEAMKRLDQVHMREFADRFPAELGDGMRKRVAIARALTMDPRYVLFDEPTTSLDPVSARRVDRLIRELSDSLGVTSIVVSHDLVSIFSIADRIAMVYQGGLRLVGTREQFQTTDDPVVKQFITGTAEGPMIV
ncbi:MAG: ATP-binding cassette domain-containing protein [Deltaproteobacteria bacterium]|nr:ATP-binding cassette domain-containing protein [Deltaproteobacteria bacterium]